MGLKHKIKLKTEIGIIPNSALLKYNSAFYTISNFFPEALWQTNVPLSILI